jgi:hypothetical protein
MVWYRYQYYRPGEGGLNAGGIRYQRIGDEETLIYNSMTYIDFVKGKPMSPW